MRRLEGKVAIVTGGGGGIGSAVARRMVLEGGKVSIADVSEESAQAAAEPLGDAALAVSFDAAVPDSIEEMVNATVEHFGGLDILHNNAAMTDPAKHPLDTNPVDIPIDIWNEIIDINLRGYLLGCKYAIPHMVERGGGSIINTASNSGIAGDLARVAYGASKGGIITLSKYVATQYGKQNIRCNSISPGVVLTPALEATVPGLSSNPALFTAINKDTAELHHELVPFDADLAQRMSDRAVRILRATDAGELLPRVARNRDFFECRFCPWAERCWSLAR